MTIRIGIADDQALVREAFERILESVHGFEVVFAVGDGEEALAAARRARPDVCVLDISMPGMTGIEVTAALNRTAGLDVAVIVLTTFDLDEYVIAALRAGAVGFITKDAGPKLLIEAIRAAHGGEAMVSPDVTRRLLDRVVGSGDHPDVGVTDREREVLVQLCLGRNNREIGSALAMSPSTVKSHVAQLLRKTGARNRVTLALWAHETGLSR